MYMRIININDVTDILVVNELSDWLWNEGYRFLEWVSNSNINVNEADEINRQLSIRQHGF